MTNYNDLKEAAEDLATALASAKAAGNVDGTADLAAMLARVQDAISQIEAAHELLFEAEDLLDKYTPNLEEALPDITGEIEELRPIMTTRSTSPAPNTGRPRRS